MAQDRAGPELNMYYQLSIISQRNIRITTIYIEIIIYTTTEDRKNLKKRSGRLKAF